MHDGIFTISFGDSLVSSPSFSFSFSFPFPNVLLSTGAAPHWVEFSMRWRLYNHEWTKLQRVRWESKNGKKIPAHEMLWEIDKNYGTGYSKTGFDIHQMDGFVLRTGDRVVRIYETQAEEWNCEEIMHSINMQERERSTIGYVLFVGTHCVSVKLGRRDYNSSVNRELHVIVDSLPHEFGKYILLSFFLCF